MSTLYFEYIVQRRCLDDNKELYACKTSARNKIPGGGHCHFASFDYLFTPLCTIVCSRPNEECKYKKRISKRMISKLLKEECSKGVNSNCAATE